MEEMEPNLDSMSDESILKNSSDKKDLMKDDDIQTHEKMILNSKVTMDKKKVYPVKKTLDVDHPLMIKYQKELKERLLNLVQETNEQIIDLKRTIDCQVKESSHVKSQGYTLQKELKQQEEKFQNINLKCENQLELKQNLRSQCEDMKQQLHSVEKTHKEEVQMDTELQENVENLAFEIVQLASLQTETYTDAKNLKRALEKTSKDRKHLELEKLRQDFLISRLETDKFKLEDKIHLYKNQWGIKKEEVNDLRKELNAANMEMQTINFEKQQIVQQWRQSLSSLGKQDQVLSEIRTSVSTFEDEMRTLKMDITVKKKSVRQELERNETLTSQLQFRESDIARVLKDLNIITEQANQLEESLSVVGKIIEITENELNFLNDKKTMQEKALENKEKLIQKACEFQKKLENKHMDILHNNIILTKASKHSEKLIKDIRKSMENLENKGSQKESEKQKLRLKLDNLHTHLDNMNIALNEVQRENKERAALLNKSEGIVLKTRERLEMKYMEFKKVENELSELIQLAGGQELAPFEREIANLRKEINLTDQGKREMETEYLRFQRELFSLNKQSTVKREENDLYKKKRVIMEGKKVQLEADVIKEEKSIKSIQKNKESIEKELSQVNRLLHERKELQDTLQQSTDLSKDDFLKILKETEIAYLQRQRELNYIQKKKRKHFRKLINLQAQIVFWEGKVYLADETRRVLKSKIVLDEMSNLKSETRCLHVKLDQIKKEQEKLVQEMSQAVYRHTDLYVQADKQSVFGKRRKTPDYVTKRIKTNLKKLHENKKLLENCLKKYESLKDVEIKLLEKIEAESQVGLGYMNQISLYENNTNDKQQEKRQAVLHLSFKQKKVKLFQKVIDKTYVRAVRNEILRPEEIQKVQNNMRAIQVICQAAINEYPDLRKELAKTIDYIIVSKHI